MSQRIMSAQLLKNYLASGKFHSLYFCDQKQQWKSPLSPIELDIRFNINEVIFSKSRNVICLKNSVCTFTINQIQSITVVESGDYADILFSCGNPKYYNEDIIYKLKAS